MRYFLLFGALCALTFLLSLTPGSTETHLIEVANNQLATRDFSNTPIGSWNGVTDAPPGGYQKIFNATPPSQDPQSIDIQFSTANHSIWLWENLSDQAVTDLWALTRIDHKLYTRDFSTVWGPVPSGQILNPIWFMRVHSAYGADFTDAPNAAPFDGVIDGLGPSGWIRQCTGQAPYGQSIPCTSMVMNPVVTAQRTIYWHNLSELQKDQWRAGKLFYYAPEVSFVGTPYNDLTIEWETNHNWWNYSDVIIEEATLQIDYNY